MAKQPRTLTRRALLGGGVGVLGASAGVGGAWALNRFVLDHVDVANASDYEGLPGTQTSTTATTASGEGTVDGTTFTSDGVELSITSHSNTSGDALAWFVADIKLTDVTLLRSAFAQDKFGTNIVDYPSNMAADVGAVWALNGDYYGFRDTGIVIRDGVAFRDEPAREGYVLYRDGQLVAYDETQTSATELVSNGAWQTLSFGPALLKDGAVISGIDDIEIDTNFGNHSIQGQQPRTGLGMIEPLHYVAVVVDGRSDGYSEGITMTGFAQLFADLGAQTAYNLDGGGSSVMIFDDEFVNNPLGRNKERETSDILWIGR